jgi:hypothetical protein
VAAGLAPIPQYVCARSSEPPVNCGRRSRGCLLSGRDLGEYRGPAGQGCPHCVWDVPWAVERKAWRSSRQLSSHRTQKQFARWLSCVRQGVPCDSPRRGEPGLTSPTQSSCADSLRTSDCPPNLQALHRRARANNSTSPDPPPFTPPSEPLARYPRLRASTVEFEAHTTRPQRASPTPPCGACTGLCGSLDGSAHRGDRPLCGRRRPPQTKVLCSEFLAPTVVGVPIRLFVDKNA